MAQHRTRCLHRRHRNTRRDPNMGNHRAGTSRIRTRRRDKPRRNIADHPCTRNHRANTPAVRKRCCCNRRCNTARWTRTCRRRSGKYPHRKRRLRTSCCNSWRRGCRILRLRCRIRRGTRRLRMQIPCSIAHRSRRHRPRANTSALRPDHRHFHPIRAVQRVHRKQPRQSCPGRTIKTTPDERVVA